MTGRACRQHSGDVDVVRPASDEGGHAERNRAGVALECGADLGDLVLGAGQAEL
jgi:hypothetical protein